MTSYDRNQAQFSPRMYPDSDDNNPPTPPERSDIRKPFIPEPPKRMDVLEDNSSTPRRQPECSCNYNRYATKKTIGHGVLEFALITSNAMQLRTLISQKQRDGVWIASLILVCVSILVQIGLAYLLIMVGKGNIEKAEKQPRLERLNNLALFITVLVGIINVIINGLMLSTNTNNFLDASTIELLSKNHS